MGFGLDTAGLWDLSEGEDVTMEAENQPESILMDVRYQIEDLLTDYCHAIDDGEWNKWPDFFTKDGIYKVITRDNYEAGHPMGIMYCDGRGMMKDRMIALETANIYEPHTYCHTISRPRLDAHGDGVKGRTNFHIIRTMQHGAMEIFAVGKYLDTFVTVDRRVRLRERIVVLESRRIDILLVMPL